MSKVEVFFLIDGEGRVLWSDASSSPVALPDSRARWEAIWERRAEIAEIAHSHPIGPMAFSREDEDTMEALITALGRAPIFSVVAPGGMVRRIDGRDERAEREPWWAQLLRRASGMNGLKLRKNTIFMGYIVRPDGQGRLSNPTFCSSLRGELGR